MSDQDIGGLTHIDERGRARMVDVTNKAVTTRRAITSCRVAGLGDAVRFLVEHPDVLPEARVAGLHAAKETSELIPLCHPLPLDGIDLDFSVSRHEITVEATASTIGQTGVEMEALTACVVAVLSLLGRTRAADPNASIEDVGLQEKRGGRSGTWRRGDLPGRRDGEVVQS